MQPRSSVSRFSVPKGRSSALYASASGEDKPGAGSAADEYLANVNNKNLYKSPDLAQNMVSDINKLQSDAARVAQRSGAAQMSGVDPALNDMNAAKSMAIQNTEDTNDATIDEDIEVKSKTTGLSSKMKNPFGAYSYVVLGLLFLIRLSDQQ